METHDETAGKETEFSYCINQEHFSSLVLELREKKYFFMRSPCSVKIIMDNLNPTSILLRQ